MQLKIQKIKNRKCKDNQKKNYENFFYLIHSKDGFQQTISEWCFLIIIFYKKKMNSIIKTGVRNKY
jgi:hypothetical protein